MSVSTLGFCVELSLSCPACRNPVPVNGLTESLPCPSCGAAVELSFDHWKGFFDAENVLQVLGMERGLGMEWSLLGHRDMQDRLNHLPARCGACKAEVPVAEFARLAELGRHTCACGVERTVRAALDWAQVVFPGARWAVDEHLGGAACRGVAVRGAWVRGVLRCWGHDPGGGAPGRVTSHQLQRLESHRTPWSAHMHRPTLFAMLALACNPPADTGDSAPAPTVPDIPNAGCGMAAYAWLPLEGMGQIVDDDEADDLSLGSAAIDFVLESYGVTQFSPLPYDVKGWRLRYTTQDKGQPVEATMVLTLPDVDDGTAFPLVVFPHGTSGFTDACAPSAGGLEENALPIMVAAMGYAVAAPDYLGMAGFGEPSGMLHPYLVPEATAVASLDSARAAVNFVAVEQPGATVDLGQTVLWGGSEGGFAVVWSELYAAEYLPEATIAATVALVPPTDLTAVARAALAAPIAASGGLVGAWVSEHSWYQAPDHDLSEILLDPIAEALPGEMMQSCSDFPSVDGIETLEDMFQPAVLEAAAAGTLGDLEPWSCYLGLSDLHGARIPRTIDPPVLVVVSEEDDLVVAATVRDSIPSLCGDGYDIDYLECAGASHAEGAVKSLPYQFQWVKDRLAGIAQDPAEVCAVDAPIDCDQILDLEE